MPRVTRRSLASKEESTPEDSSKSTSHRKRGAKKEEPTTEDVTIGEPQGAPSKRGGRQAAKVSKTEASGKGKAANRGRSTSRGGRGKKVEEPESEEEEDDDDNESEEEGEKVSKGRASSKGKGKGARGGKSTPVTKNRAGRGKAAEEEEENVEVERNVENEDAEVSSNVSAKGRGNRSRGKTSAVTPSPQGVKRGRGRAAAAEENEEKMEEDKKEDSEEAKDIENEVEVTPKGRQRHAQNKETKPETPPPTGGRRSRGQKTEPTPKTSPASGRSSAKAGEASTSAAPEKQSDMIAAEPMDTEEEPETLKTETEKEEISVPEMVTEESAEQSPSKKRKLEEEEDEHTAKRLKAGKDEAVEDLEDFVVISKDDVPGPNSKEVADSLPPAVAEKLSLPTTPEDSGSEGPRINPLMAASGVPFVVPLTEAELAKQYSQERDKDETSSILVEVGSECASDITGLSSRGLDFSDVVSLDSMDQAFGEGATDLTKDPISPSSNPQTAPLIFQQPNVSGVDQAVMFQTKPSSAASEDAHSTKVDLQPSASPVTAVNPDLSQADQSSGILEVHAESVSLQNTCNNATPQPLGTTSQNGTVELTSKPEKTVPESYVPSSTAIDNRKFILNPSFPVEMMDPAFCFSVVSYNVLADCHLRRGDYSYTQPQHLDQEYRHTLLLKELDYLEGDIICLQEVSPTYYTQTLLPAMKSRGYDGQFIKRTKEYWDEGEATFVRTSKFDIVSQQSLSLGDLAFKEVDDSALKEEVSQAAKKYLDRADVILLTELRCKKTNKLITVCNIHVVYDLKAPDVQCIQVACAIKQLVAKAGSDLSPHIICGDFNSEVTSPSYQLAKDGYLSDDHIHKLQALQNLDNADGSSRALINHMWRAFQHTSSNLKSSYELTLGKEPPITSFTKNTHTTLDYIFHSASSVDTVGVLETLDLHVVDATGGLPSINVPSDHLSLKALFRLKD